MKDKWYNWYTVKMEKDTINILLVEDDAEFASLVKQDLHSFQSKKFQVTWVQNGESALQHLTTTDAIDVVLMDYYLPNQNGLEITKKIFETHPNFPIILLTSNKDFRIAVEAMKYGMEEYLVKDAIADTILPRTILNAVDRFKLKKTIAEAEKAKLITQKRTEAIQELVVTMCHEFNNPLAAVKISADILSRQKITEEEKTALAKLNKNISLLEKQIIKLRDLNFEK